MKIIDPLTITPSNMTTSVPETEPDATVWAAQAYIVGKVVIRNHHVFEAVGAATATDIPGQETTVPFKWLDRGPTNPWRMFAKDAKQLIPNSNVAGSQQSIYLIGTKTVNLNQIKVSFTPGIVANSIALFGLVGYQVTIKVTDPTEGVLTTRVISLADTNVSNMWQWLFKPIGRKENIAITDLPSYGSATIEVTIDAAAGTNAECSMCSIGPLDTLGITCFGTSIGITDYSVKKQDDFGNDYVLERGYRDRIQYDVRMNSDQVYRVKTVLARLRAKGAVYIGAEKKQETLIYGRYRDLEIVLDNYSISNCALDVGSLL